MKVILKDKIYEMNRKQFHGLLDVARESMKIGIYAVKKDGVAEMKNEQFDNKTDLQKAIAEYVKLGFKVYCNCKGEKL